jgi:exonuclease SbcD
LVELGEKGSPVSIQTLVIPPLHPMRELRGPFRELRDAELESPRRGEYLRVVLTDQRVSPEIAAFFRELCEGRDSVLMELCSEYAQPAGASGALSRGDVEEKSVEELFADFYTDRSGGVEPTGADRELLGFAGEILRRAAPHSVPTGYEIGELLDFLTRQEENA